MSDWLLNFAHRHLKLIFVVCFIGSSSIFFDGGNIPVPHPVLGAIGIGLGFGIELCYWMFSTDLTKAITKRDVGGILINLIFTLFGMGASWFLFTNAALVLGWAPKTAILPGVDRSHWAFIIGGVVSGLVLALSLRREHPKDETDITAIAYSVTRVAPYASNEEKLRLMGELSTASAKYSHRPESRPTPRLGEALSAGQPQGTPRASLQAEAPRSTTQPAASLAAPKPSTQGPGLVQWVKGLFSSIQEVPAAPAALPAPGEDAQHSELPPLPRTPERQSRAQAPTGEQVAYPADVEEQARLLSNLLDEQPPYLPAEAEPEAPAATEPPFPGVRKPAGGEGNHRTPVQGVYQIFEEPGHRAESESADDGSF